jgi:hypothetical protein
MGPLGNRSFAPEGFHGAGGIAMDEIVTGHDELAQLIPAQLPVDMASVFPKRKGLGLAKKNKKRALLLAEAAAVLGASLGEGERILGVSQAVANLWWEAYFLGWMSYAINTTTLVVTDQRLLLIHTNNKGKVQSYANAIPFSAVKKVKKGALFGFLSLELAQGRFSFTRIARQDAKRIKELVRISQNPEGGRQYLCPACFHPHKDHATACGQCRTQVKSPQKAAFRSLFLPGLGDFYLGHRMLAVFEMVGSAFGWLILLGFLASALTDDNPDTQGASWALFGIFAVIVGLGHGVDMLLTRAMGKKGMISMDGALPTTGSGKPPHQNVQGDFQGRG